MSRKPMAATDGSQLTAYSLRPSDSEPSAVSRWPLAHFIGGRIDICLAVGIFWT